MSAHDGEVHMHVFRMPGDTSGAPDTRYTFRRNDDGWFVVTFTGEYPEYIGKSLDGETASRIAQYHADTDTSVRSPLIATDYPVRPLPPEQVASPLAGMDVMTCGVCHRSWDDARVTSMTPTPSGRCPFEFYHDEEPDEGPSPTPSVPEPSTFVVTHVGSDGDEYVPKYRGTYTWTPDLLIVEGVPMMGTAAGSEPRRIEYPRERVVRVTTITTA